MQKTKRKVSIIIPIYNVEKFVDRCIKSVAVQSYRNIEIILVIDGATDGSLQICQNWAKKDSRILIKKKKNGGLSSARNLGMKYATGDYILFVDGDDWIDLNCVKNCIDNITDADIIMFSFSREYGDKSKIAHIFKQKQIIFVNNDLNKLVRRLVGPIGRECLKPHSMEDINLVCNKMYCRKLLNNLEFTDTRIIGTEDLWFNLQAFNKASKIIYIDKSLYHYNKTNDLSLTKTYNNKLFPRWKILYKYIDEFIQKNWKEEHIYQLALKNRIVLNLLALVRNITNSNLEPKMQIKELDILFKDPIYQLSFSEFDFSHLPLHWKIFYYACKKKSSRFTYLLINIAELFRKLA